MLKSFRGEPPSHWGVFHTPRFLRGGPVKQLLLGGPEKTVTPLLISNVTPCSSCLVSCNWFIAQESPTVFSAGLDIMEMYKPQPDRLKMFWTTLQQTWLKLYSAPYPTVAAINVSSLPYLQHFPNMNITSTTSFMAFSTLQKSNKIQQVFQQHF